MEKRIFQLKNSSWSWDQAEYQRLLDTVDVNQLVEGRPLFVALAIEANDPPMLQRMIRRGANVNSSDWGCTPMLAALEADRKAIKENETLEHTTLTNLVMRAGANANLLPSPEGIDRRLATGVPKSECGSFDHFFKEQPVSLLRIVVETAKSPELLNMLLAKGASPKGRKDALHILRKAIREGGYGPAEDPLVELALSRGASIDEAFSGDTLYGDTDTAIAHAVHYGGADRPRELATLLRHGADPNKRTSEGHLPLELVIDHCARPSVGMFLEMSRGSDYLTDIAQRDWREGDRKAVEANGSISRSVEVLLEGGANPNLPLMRDGDGGSLLAHAVKNCPSDVPRILVTFKAKIDRAAINAAHFDLKKYLLDRAGETHQ